MTEDEIRLVLKRKLLKVLTHVQDKPHEDYYGVIWIDKGKVKVGMIRNPYYHRYGIDTQATYNGKHFWFKSGDIADDMPQVIIDHMKALSEGEYPVMLADFDPNSIEVRW